MLERFQNIKIKHIVAVMAAAFVILLYFLVYGSEFLYAESAELPSTSYIGEITRDMEIWQEIEATEDDLRAIKIYLGSFERVNHSNLTITLSDGEEEIQTWVLDCSLLTESPRYYTFRLDNKIKDSKGKIYYLTLTSDAEEGSGIAIQTADGEVQTRLYVNGEPNSEQTLCLKMVYTKSFKNLFLGANGIHVVLFFVICAALLIFVLFAQRFKIQHAFLVTWGLLCCMAMFSSTIFNVPDEDGHFYRAYEVSYGHLVSKYKPAKMQAGYKLPLDVDISLLEEDWETFSENKDMQVSENRVFLSYPNQALMSPASYMPQAIGIFIARHLTNSVAAIAYTGRIFNLLFITLLLYFAIKTIPIGKEILALIFLMPMNVQESVSLSPDGAVVGLTAFMIAYVLKLRIEKGGRLRLRQYVLLYLMAFLISQYKIVYLPFCFVYFLIPAKRFGSLRNKVIHAIAVAGIAGASGLLWVRTCSDFMLTKGTNPTWQIQYILREPFEYFITMCRYVFHDLGSELMNVVGGSMNERVVDVGLIVILVYVFMLVLYFGVGKINELGLKAGEYTERRTPLSGADARRDRVGSAIIFGSIVLIVFALILTAEYIQWTGAYETLIDGVQGRYFIALLCPLYFLINGISKPEVKQLSFGAWCVVVCVNACVWINVLFDSLA